MSCLNPISVLLVPDESSSTGQKIQFLRGFDRYLRYEDLKHKYGDQLICLPCGKCVGCVEDRVRSWAIRCSLEAQQYENNCFITLTYNPSNLPDKGVCRKDVQRFIKNLRHKFGEGIRYFGAAEYGSLGRAHYHLILFNFFPPDARPIKQSEFGGMYYESKVVQSLWRTKDKLKDGKYHSLGFVSVGDCSYNSCAYVARYCGKKIGKELGIVGVNKEFNFMSRRPGIGEKYFRDHFHSLVETDNIYGHFGDRFVSSSFRYFDKLLDRVDSDRLKELKSARISKSQISIASELFSRGLPDMESYVNSERDRIEDKYKRLRRYIS